MKLNKKRNIVIGIIISVVLSLFVNYSLFAQRFESVLAGNVTVSAVINEPSLAIFSFLWFITIAFVLYLITVWVMEWGKGLLRKEYKAILLAALTDMLVVFALIQLYDVVENQLSDKATGNFAIVEGFEGGMTVTMVDSDTLDFHTMTIADSLNRVVNVGHYPATDGGFGMELTPTIADMIYKRPVMTEHVFVLVTVFMFVMLLRILDSRQEMVVKIEKLQKENLQSSYNALMGQINPHFFFNSLGGLNSLIRSGEQERTLTYLEELTSVFRYILQSNHKEIVSLSEELDFMKAYVYLLGIRYEGKLFFSMDINSRYMNYRLPVLSLLPLIENAIKHNVMSKSLPLHIDIYVSPDGNLIISNLLQPKPEKGDCTGIGLRNLSGRYKLLTDRDITVTEKEGQFEVRLPLLKPSEG